MNRTILMLEHDEDDRYITQAIFDEYKLDVSINFVSNSNELISFLENGIGKKASLPSLILLNYHTSPMTALEILRALKSNDYFSYIPVVVLSGTAQPEIVKACYANGASSFIKKPSSKVETKILTFARYWFETAHLA